MTRKMGMQGEIQILPRQKHYTYVGVWNLAPKIIAQVLFVETSYWLLFKTYNNIALWLNVISNFLCDYTEEEILYRD